MKEGDVVVGTVRAKRSDDEYVIVTRDGEVLDVTFHGKTHPLIGGDVVGRLHLDEHGKPNLVLRENVLDLILSGTHKIYVLGQRPDMTARMLAKVLARSKSAVVSPGSSISINRSPQSSDEDLNWALNSFREESERRGAALNVIDVQALARSPWEQKVLRDMALPADIEGNQRTLSDLTVLMRAGFKPFCSRIVDRHTEKNEISVNFILPYSPFVGAIGYARSLASMGRFSHPHVRMTSQEARRYCSARTIALGMAHNCLGPSDKMQTDVDSTARAKHLAACFADAAATLAFLHSGGRRTVIAEVADLKEASLHYGQSVSHTTPGVLKEGVLIDATHKAIRAAFSVDISPDATMRDMVVKAARIAKKVALPASRFGSEYGRDVATPEEIKSAKIVASGIGSTYENMSPSQLLIAREEYRNETKELVSSLSDNDLSGGRLALFGGYAAPDEMRDIFEEEAGHLYQLDSPPNKVKVEPVINKEKFALKIKNKKSNLEEEFLQFSDDRAELNFH